MRRARVAASALAHRVRSGRPVVHMLHIGKTGGTAVKARLHALNADPACPVFFLLHQHAVTLRDLPPRARYFFAVRDPITRFCSGFYSRKRQGQPRYYYPWTQAEEAAFARYPEANDLAEALRNPSDGEARRAMQAIRHVNAPHLAWFDGEPDLPLNRHRPVAILRQSDLQDDFARMLARLGVTDAAAKAALPRAADAAHQNDYAGVPPLSDAARAALREWYARDIDFFDTAIRRAAAMA